MTATQELDIRAGRHELATDYQGLFSTWEVSEITAHAVDLAARHMRAAVGLFPFMGVADERLRRPGGGRHRRPGGRHRKHE